MKRLILLILILLLTGCKSNDIEVKNNEDIVVAEVEVEEEIVLHDVTGYYEGNIDVNGTPVPLTLNIEYGETLTGYIDIKLQNVFDLTLEEVRIDQNNVSFVIDLITSKGYFEGVFVEDKYIATFTQSGQSFPVEFVLSVKAVKENREILAYLKDGIRLKGEYIIPIAKEKMPIALIIGGSGPTDMDGNSAAGVYTNTYLYLAESLEKAGIATLRYNKRILDNEILSEEAISFEDFVEDALNLTEILKVDERFNEVYLIGHSQGALIAKIVANRTKVDKLVSLAGAGSTIDQVLIDQLTPQLSEEQLSEAKFIIESLKAGERTSDVPDLLLSVFRESIQPFMISWFKYDPQEIIQVIDTDILIVVGGYDIQVPVKEGEYLYQSRPDADFVIIDTMNHVLKETIDDINDNYKTYTNIDLPVHSELIKAIIDFFNK